MGTDRLHLPDPVWDRISEAVGFLEKATERGFGRADCPLLLALRSGPPVLGGHTMETIRALGITDDIEEILRRGPGETALTDRMCNGFREQFERTVGHGAPADPWDQLRSAILAVLSSERSQRAYRRSRGVDIERAVVTIQAMVFGNRDEWSGSGVLITRNPLNGSPDPYGQWTPIGRAAAGQRAETQPLMVLGETMPRVYVDLLDLGRRLEHVDRTVQDIEFTVDGGKLWLGPTRPAVGTPEAVLRHAMQLHREGLLDVDETLRRIEPQQVRALLRPRLDPLAVTTADVVATGLPEGSGLITGCVLTEAQQVLERAAAGQAVIFARATTDNADTTAITKAAAVLTDLGGLTSHAAVACRKHNVPGIVGCGNETVTVLAGQTVTVDATLGTVYRGELPIVPAADRHDADLSQLAELLGVDAADTPVFLLPDILRRRRNQTGAGS